MIGGMEVQRTCKCSLMLMLSDHWPQSIHNRTDQGRHSWRKHGEEIEGLSCLLRDQLPRSCLSLSNYIMRFKWCFIDKWTWSTSQKHISLCYVFSSQNEQVICWFCFPLGRNFPREHLSHSLFVRLPCAPVKIVQMDLMVYVTITCQLGFNRARLKGFGQVWWILLVLLLTTPAWAGCSIHTTWPKPF